jgi:hypothetical protein
MNGRRKDNTMRLEDENKIVKFFNQHDQVFEKACADASTKVTKRQASKWLMHKGIACKKMKGEL